MILSADAIACRRGSKDVLRGVTFALSSGQIMAVTGPNGSGKSTLLRLLAGLNDPADGTLTLDDRPFESRDIAHWIGPDTPLKPTLTVQENLSFWMAMQGDRPHEDSILKALHRFEIAHLADRRAQTLSSGQKRRAIMARLFLSPRPLWLLDEPESALDAQGREDLMTALHEHCGNKGAAIIATHQPELWQPTFTLTLQKNTPATGFTRLPPSDTPQTRLPPRSRIAPVLAATIAHDLNLARRGKADCLQPLMLFLLVILLFPLSLGPDAATLSPVAGGLIMMAAFFASLLPLEKIFSDDAADSTIETLMTTNAPLPVYCAGRMLAHWLTGGLPLVLAAPLAGVMLGAGIGDCARLALVMLPVTLLFTMIGSAVSALVLSARRGAMLLALLTAPLYIPVLIFGAGAMAGAEMPLPLLFAMTAILLPVSPLVTSGCLALMKD